MTLITDRGFYDPERLPNNANVLSVDALGYAAFAKPTIIQKEEYGIYYTIRTDMMKMSLSANSDMFISNSPYKKELVCSVCDTLIGTKIKIPARAYNNAYTGYPLSENQIMLYALTKLKRTKIIGGGISIKSHIPEYRKILEELLHAEGISYEVDDSRVSHKYTIFCQRDDGKKISSDIVAGLNASQARAFMSISFMFDNLCVYKSHKGYNILCEQVNSPMLCVVAIKAGFRVYVGNEFGYSNGVDSINIKNSNEWAVKILDCKMSQNEKPDKIITLPDRYKGIFVVADGYIMILPNLKIN